jgi:serine/threonine protein kinase
MPKPLKTLDFPPKPARISYSAKNDELTFYYNQPAIRRKPGLPPLSSATLKLHAAKPLSGGHSSVKLFSNKKYQAVVKVIPKSQEKAKREFDLYLKATHHEGYLLNQGPTQSIMIVPMIYGVTLQAAMTNDCTAFCQNLLITLLVVLKSLKSLHENDKISHGDLKANNIFLGEIHEKLGKDLSFADDNQQPEADFSATFIDFEFSTSMGSPVIAIDEKAEHLPYELIHAPETLLASPAIDNYSVGYLLRSCLNAANTTIEKTIFYDWYRSSQSFAPSERGSLDGLIALVSSALQSAKMAKAKELDGKLCELQEKISQQLEGYQTLNEFYAATEPQRKIHCLAAQEIIKIATQRVYEIAISPEESFPCLEALLAYAIEQLCIDEAFGLAQDPVIEDFLETCSEQQLYQIACDFILSHDKFNQMTFDECFANIASPTLVSSTSLDTPPRLSQLSLPPMFQSPQQLTAPTMLDFADDCDLPGPSSSKSPLATPSRL